MIKLPGFICSQENPDDADILVCGIPYDCTSSFRSGSRFAPREIRIVSEEAIEEFSFSLGKSLFDIKFCDIGDMPIMVGGPRLMVNEVIKEFSKLIKKRKKIIAIGGEHLITYPIFLELKKAHNDFSILQLDAHADLRDSYSGDELNHASVMNICLKNGLKRLLQFGIRSGTKEEYEMRQKDSRIFACNNLFELKNAIKEKENIYLSLDLDFFDPGFLPGTGTPESGGASYNDFIEILKIIQEKKVNIIGADIVELSPQIDMTGNSTIFTAKILRELLLTMTPLS